jgi:hypothetical protein
MVRLSTREKERRQEAFLTNYRELGEDNLSEACRRTGISKRCVSDWRSVDPGWAVRLDAIRRDLKQRSKAAKGAEWTFDPHLAKPAVPGIVQFRWDYIGRPTPAHQQPIVKAWEDETNLVVIVLAPPGPQPVWATVTTPLGEQPIGNIRPGDLVLGYDGQPTRVSQVLDAGILPCWRLDLHGGPSVFAAGPHQWPAVSSHGDPMQTSTEEIASKVRNEDGRCRFRLLTPGPLQFASTGSPPLDPYVLGVLLGDGSFRQNTVKFTTIDPQIVEEVRRRLPPGVAVHNYSNDIHWRLVTVTGHRRSIIRSILSDLGLADRNAHEKHIPDVYLTAPTEDRWALLRGLMDTDGSVGVRNRPRASFVTCSPQLRDDVIHLVRSLGGKAWEIHEDARRRPTWTLQVITPQCPFSLRRKVERWKPPRFLWHRIDGAEAVGMERCVCLTVDSADHVYLTNGVPTCNSGKDTLAGDIVLRESVTGYNRVAWLMANADFSMRRLSERVAPYLSDPRAYDVAPRGPGCQKPTRSLIDDYGPFAWKSGMRYPNGDRVPQPTWTKNSMYFLGRETEADPNLWATGVEATLYGARIDRAITSDIFTAENQGSPAVRAGQMSWMNGTFLSRLDESGRLLHLGTRVSANDNNGLLLSSFVGDAAVVEQDGFYTKHANGVATIIYPAILTNADGEEESYWPERFSLDSYLILDGVEYPVPDLSMKEQQRLSAAGARRVRGLREMRDRDPQMFATLYQQQPPSESSGEFSRDLLDHCDDPSRTLGVFKPGETLVLGIDPARAGGAAWVLWGYDDERNVCTLVDYFYGERLGIAGIREKLLIDPIHRYWPRYATYEFNREESVLEHPQVMSALKDTRTELVRTFTASNRNEGETRVAAMTFDLRDGSIRFPAATREDRLRMDRVKEHAINWDSRTQSEGRTARGHLPDDLWMAAWVGWATIKQRLCKKHRRILRDRQIPQIVLRRWGVRPQQVKKGPAVAPETDLVKMWGGDA